MENLKTVTIQSIAFGGDGVARLEDGCVLFVPFTAVGDVAEVEITDQRKTFARAELRRLITPGPGRCEPVCRHFGRCGGCAYQHLDYAAEFEAKKAQLNDALRRIGGFRELPELSVAVPAPEILGYRNKLSLEPGKPDLTDQGYHLAYGYYQNDNKTFFTVKECPLARPEINRALPKAIRSPLGKQNARRKPAPAKIVLRSDSQHECSFYFGFAPSKHPWLHETVRGKNVMVPLGSFWQVNPPVADKLLKHVDQWARAIKADTLIDAYSGVGTFSLALTAEFKERILIESDAQAAEAANFNHQTLGLGCIAISGLTEKALPKQLMHCDLDATLVILDPPRTGCMPSVVEDLRKHSPADIIYVSCNPTTLARDLKALCADGKYAIDQLAMFDMFPRTGHFETAVKLITSIKELCKN